MENRRMKKHEVSAFEGIKKLIRKECITHSVNYYCRTVEVPSVSSRPFGCRT
jgi:hypothetical protein